MLVSCVSSRCCSLFVQCEIDVHVYISREVEHLLGYAPDAVTLSTYQEYRDLVLRGPRVTQTVTRGSQKSRIVTVL